MQPDSDPEDMSEVDLGTHVSTSVMTPLPRQYVCSPHAQTHFSPFPAPSYAGGSTCDGFSEVSASGGALTSCSTRSQSVHSISRCLRIPPQRSHYPPNGNID